MSKKDLADYIREQMSQPPKLGSEDLEPVACVRCGDELDMTHGDVTTWDVEGEDGTAIFRTYYCSEQHKKEEMQAAIDGEETQRFGKEFELPKEDGRSRDPPHGTTN